MGKDTHAVVCEHGAGRAASSMLGNAISVPSLALCCALAVGAAGYLVLWRRGGVGSGRSCQLKRGSGVIDLIGETPLVELRSLSEQTGCQILVLHSPDSLFDRSEGRALSPLRAGKSGVRTTWWQREGSSG